MKSPGLCGGELNTVMINKLQSNGIVAMVEVSLTRLIRRRCILQSGGIFSDYYSGGNVEGIA